MLQSSPIGVQDLDSSKGQRTGGHNVLSRSEIGKPSRDRGDETTLMAVDSCRQNNEKGRCAVDMNEDGAEAIESQSDSNDANDKSNDSDAPARRESTTIDLNGLSRPGLGTRDRLGESPEESAARLERLKGAVRTMLECVGEDPNREGLLATPERYAKAMMFFTKGYEQNILDIVNGAVFHENHDEMIVVKNIEIYSLCEHHLVPFTGLMHIGYVPDKTVIGISKLPRIADMFAQRLQVQERLTKSVANAVFEVLQPQGVAVVMESKHLCMAMRGVQKATSTTVTSCMTGCFERKTKTRNEFLGLINVNR